MNEGFNKLIDVINRLLMVAQRGGLDPISWELPKITVVGEQSAGKSSVLENFIGRDFLPRGNGIVTRRPLILQLYSSRNGEEWAEMLQQNGDLKKLNSFHDVRYEIQAETDRIAGTNKGISQEPINLRVYSPNVLNLTLVDLPGLTKVPVGDQPEDIEDQIRDLILKYITQENTLILAVSPATQDLANSDSLKLAREVDPRGERTIGVITKLDLMDQGTDFKDVLENKVYPLKRGYIGVVNRSQKDIEERKDINEAQKKEKEFFKMHNAYRHLAEKNGTSYLQTSLNRQLESHIAMKLPGLRSALLKKKANLEAQLKHLGADSSTTDMNEAMSKLIESFKEEVKKVIEGNTVNINSGEIEGGAVINYTYYHDVYDMLDMDGSPSEKEIAYRIKNLHGYRNPLFLPELAFESTVKALVQRYKKPMKHAVKLIAGILNGIVEKSAKMLDMYPVLHQESLFLVTGHIQKQQDMAETALLTYIDAECAFMNTKHPDFRELKYREDPFRKSPSPVKLEKKENSPPLPGTPEIHQKVLYKGNLFHNSRRFGFSKCHWAVLSNEHIILYGSDKEREEKFRIWLSGVSCVYKRDEKTGFSRFIFTRTNGQFICNNQEKVELELRNTDSEVADHWIDNLQKCGVNVDRRGSSSSLSSWYPVTENGVSESTSNNRKDIDWQEMVSGDPELTDQARLLSKMVHSYMNIIDKTVHDLTPKYISLLLVQDTMRYVTMSLAGDLMKRNITPEIYMQASGEKAAKIEELTTMLQTTTEAVEILEAVSLLSAKS